MLLKNPEFGRKMVHLSSLAMPIVYYFTNQAFMTGLIEVIFIAIVLWEIARFTLQIGLLHNLNKLLLRGQEAQRLSGGFFFILACLIAVTFFSKYLFITSVTVLIIADTVAAYVGINFGRNKFLDKSLEGSLGFFIAGLLVVVIVNYLFNLPLLSIKLVIVVLITTILEAIANFIKIDDNLLIVLGFALSYTLL